MNELLPVYLLATGSCAPERVLTNDDLAHMVDTSDEWITSRTGIKERRLASEEESTSTFAVTAARRALDAAGLTADDLDLILVATVTGDHPFPATSCLVQAELKAFKAAAFDINAACSGFVYGLSVASQMVAAAAHRNVLVIGAETLSKITDYTDRSSCILFGDGAGAVVLSNERPSRHRVQPTFRLYADGTGGDVIRVLGGGSARPLTVERVQAGEHFMRIRGREVYKFAVAKFVELVQEQCRLNPDHELGIVIPHQVNQRIIESARSRLELEEHRVYSNIDRFGNTSAASIPMALDEVLRSSRATELVDKLVVICAFGAGLTWAGGSLVW